MTRIFKTELTEEEFREVKDLVCNACLENDPEIKQWYLLEIGGLLTGSKEEFIQSAEDQGYNINKGKEPI